MAPKFRGDSDDWLDTEEEGSSTGKRAGVASKKPKKRASAQSISEAEANATVAEVFPNVCRVKLDSSANEILCSYRRASVIGREGEDSERERSPVAVGDRVLATQTGPGQGVVESVADRRNFLCRPAPGESDVKKLHVIAANLDLLVIVTAARTPEFAPGIVDRFLIASLAAGIPALICVNKMELIPDQEIGVEQPWDLYRKLGFEVALLSAKQALGITELRRRLSGKKTAFCGHSGVGKTSLLRALTGQEIGRVGDVNLQTGKGRHTTTSAVLIPGPEESTWIDTPGVKEFGLHRVTPENLATYFPEFQPLRCKIAGCLHVHEEGCVAQNLPRHSSYLRIRDSLLEEPSS